VDLDLVQDIADAPHPGVRVLDGHPPCDPMDFITFLSKIQIKSYHPDQ
jgi:hypothetical protein